MFIDHDLLRLLSEQRREELRRAMERTRPVRPGEAAREPRHSARTVVGVLHRARREA